jgi:uncharacterized protein YdeI (BOF family)
LNLNHHYLSERKSQNMRWQLWSSLIVSAAIATSAPAIAQQAPTAQRINIAQLTQSGTQIASEQGVTISGRVAQIVGNEFGLSDLTGQVVVQVGSDWKQTPTNLKVGEEITVIGNLGPGRKFQATRIQTANGQVINVPPSNNTQSLQPR